MGLLGGLFNGKQKREDEKKEYIDKLTPYKHYIENYSDLIEQLLEHDIDVIKTNVDKTIKRFDFENHLESKHGDEVGKKLYTEGIFLDMTEEQFDDCMKYKEITGSGMGKFFVRKEEILKTKTKVVRSNSRKTKNPNRIDLIFENDKLTNIKKYK